MNGVIKYPGSKWSIAKWIISFFPEHHSYLEPFFGSGAVLFNKPRSHIETINDLDGNVVNLFECIRTDPERLARSIYMTPFARQVYEEAFLEIPKDPFEKALNFFIRLNMGYGFRTAGGRVGWKNDIQGREKSYASADWCKLPDKLMQYAERLRGVQIENRTAIELIQRFNYEKVLIYCDPPYMFSTRSSKQKQYAFEMPEEDHYVLLNLLLMHRGPVIISGYDSELYNEMLAKWNRYETTTYSQSGQRKREVIWMNYDLPVKQISFTDYVI
ncbi:MAG: DNA adenine methylase [Clostridiales bacterium]|nr:DNA adenine methylase [Clostridiales bacterium]